MRFGATCFCSLGSNLGDRVGHLVGAVEALASRSDCRLLRTANLFETAPVGGPIEQGAFLNTVIVLQTGLSPVGMLRAALDLEQRLGRRRTMPNGPRVIDIDLLLFDDLICDTPELVLPHPRMHLRRFVLEPLMQVDADRLHPVLKRRPSELLADMEPGEFQRQRCVPVDQPAWTRGVQKLVVDGGATVV